MSLMPTLAARMLRMTKQRSRVSLRAGSAVEATDWCGMALEDMPCPIIATPRVDVGRPDLPGNEACILECVGLTRTSESVSAPVSAMTATPRAEWISDYATLFKVRV